MGSQIPTQRVLALCGISSFVLWCTKCSIWNPGSLKRSKHPASRLKKFTYTSTVEGSSLLHKSQVCIPLYCCTSLCIYCVLRILHASEAIRKAKMALRFAHTNRTSKQADMNMPFVAFLAIKTHHRSTTSGGAHHSLATSFRTPFYMTLYRPFLRHFSSHHVVRSTLWSLHPLKRAQLVKGRRSARDPGTSTRDGH